MGILSKLFGGQKESDGSYVCAWADRRQRELRTSDHLSPENLFAAMMYGLATFGKKDPRSKTPSELKGMRLDTSGNYSDDAALFELGCYMYFRIDIWLYQHEPDRRKEISTVFVREFITLFSQALAAKDIADIFSQRVSGFGQLARNGADAERYHFHLSQLILRSGDNRHPENYDFDTAPLMIAGIFEDMGVKIELASWEQAMLPAMVESLKNYCNLT